MKNYYEYEVEMFEEFQRLIRALHTVTTSLKLSEMQLITTARKI